MIGLAITAGKWLAGGAWKWVVPALAFLALGAWGGWQYIGKLSAEAGLADCKTEAAMSIARAEKAARDFLEKDHARAVKLVTEYASQVADLQGKFQDAQIKLARTPSVAACRNTPAGNSFDAGVRALERDSGQAGGGDPPGAARASPQVPAATGAPRDLRR